jgi:hypothetical protein
MVQFIIFNQLSIGPLVTNHLHKWEKKNLTSFKSKKSSWSTTLAWNLASNSVIKSNSNSQSRCKVNGFHTTNSQVGWPIFVDKINLSNFSICKWHLRSVVKIPTIENIHFECFWTSDQSLDSTCQECKKEIKDKRTSKNSAFHSNHEFLQLIIKHILFNMAVKNSLKG